MDGLSEYRIIFSIFILHELGAISKLDIGREHKGSMNERYTC